VEADRDLRPPQVKPASIRLGAAIAAASALTFAATGAGGGSAPPASSFDASFGAVETLRGEELARVPGSRARVAVAAASRKSAKLSYFTTVNFETVVAGGDQLYEIRCPKKRQPLTGGVFSATPGLAIVNSTRISPDPDRPTLSGAWYEGVVNLTGTALQWKPLLVCVRS
jgi:hypothetical protein